MTMSLAKFPYSISFHQSSLTFNKFEFQQEIVVLILPFLFFIGVECLINFILFFMSSVET
jgi:hypothetical protein